MKKVELDLITKVRYEFPKKARKKHGMGDCICAQQEERN